MAAPRAVSDRTPHLPASLADIRRLFDAFDWLAMAQQVEEETLTRLAIVGPVNSGKSTLFNLLKGRDVSPVTAVPGTTRELLHEQWGPFTLTDTPGVGEVDGVDRANIALEGVRTADVIVVILDAIAGVRQADVAFLRKLRATGKPVVVALNKIDLLGKDRDSVIADARSRLVEPDLIPISARRGTNVAYRLLPRLIDAYPPLAVSLGRTMPVYRRQASRRVIRGAAAISAVLGAEPMPGLDIPFLLATQARMVLRIAAIYGEPMSAQHAKELVATILGGLTFRYLAQEGAKVVPLAGWAVAGTVASLGTWAIGQVAVRYFEHGKKLTARQLQTLYGRKLRGRQGVDEIELAAGSGTRT
jgi:small GTP-binding protein